MGILAKWAAIATIATFFVTVVGLLVVFPQLRLAGVESSPADSAPSPADPSGLQPESAGPSKPSESDSFERPAQRNLPDREGLSSAANPPPPVAASPSPVPVELSLADGEQKILLGGRVGVAIEFSRVGQMELETLRLHTDGATENHPLLGSGGRFEFTAGGEMYVLSVLRLDTSAGRAWLRVDSRRS